MIDQNLTAQDREQAIKQLFFDMKMLVELGADFSNGIVAEGCDQGSIQSWELWGNYMVRAKNLGIYSENNPSEKWDKL